MNHSEIEAKWQKKWLESGIWKSKRENEKKFFMHFAYPGVSGYQHVGHMRGYSYTDIICRFKRMTGHDVFFPVGVHATGNQAISFARKIQAKDEKWIDYLKNNGCSEEDIQKMKDPEFVVDYFVNNYKENWEKFGFLADWDSMICTTYPDYNKFIEWQFMKLKEKGYLIQEPYNATFCLNCGPVAVDASETDISKGGNAEKHEYTIIKFRINDEFLIAATLRPETMHGQTNLWVNPEEEYVKVRVNNEIWICSKQCAEKLKNQKDNIEILSEKITGKELIGKKALAPSVERKIIILPSKFTDPNIGTGIVTSVPSDAPYDLMALKDLQENDEEIRKYNLNPQEIKSIGIIPIINSKDYGDMPAVKICAEMKIKDQNDPRLEEATKEIYKAGFHTGVLNKNCGEFAGMNVSVAKEKMKEKLIKEKKADTMHDLSEEVICRCGEKVIIKKIDDQWFIKYSDKEWTEKSKKHAESMKIMPKDYAKNIASTLDWFQNRACARLGNWMGTKLPFDRKWTVEPISDSTLYPAYYVVSRFFNAGKIKLEEMSEDFFDFVFLGKGNAKSETWNEIKNEFEHWCPVDINLSGKEHQTVHFPVYIMNHVALLPEGKWPKGIFSNYWVTGKGGKLSKSKGGASSSPTEAAKIYSVDGMRLYYAHSASPFIDVEWNEDTVFSYKSHAESVFRLAEKLISLNSSEKTSSDDWILSRAHSSLKEYISLMEDYDLRKAVSVILFEFTKDIQQYLSKGGSNKETAGEVLEILLKTLAPFIPHTCEECWEKAGNSSLISSEQIPEFNESKISLKAEESEKIINSLERDIKNVIQLAKIEKPKKITIFIAGDWKRNAWKKAKNLEPRSIMKELMQEQEMKENSQTAVRYAQWLQKNAHSLEEVITADEELSAVKESVKSLAEKFSCEVEVMEADKSDNPKAGNAVPGKPAILVG